MVVARSTMPIFVMDSFWNMNESTKGSAGACTMSKMIMMPIVPINASATESVVDAP